MSTTTNTALQTEPQISTSEVVATHNAGTATQVSIKARSHNFTIDEPSSLGGDDVGATPVEHLLAGLGACQVITFQVWAQKLGVQVDSVDVELSGDIDLRGFFGTAEGVRPGFETIRVNVTLSGPESQERYNELVETVEKHCPVLDNLRSTVPVETTFAVI